MSNYSTNPHIEGLVDLACRDGVDIRPTLLRVLTDLYVQKTGHTPEEDAQYSELAQRLIDTVDAATRAAVAAKLRAYPETPEALLRRLSAPPEPSGHAPPLPATMPASPDAELLELFLSANPDERRLILTNLDAAAPATRGAGISAAPDTIGRLENAALRHNTGELARLLERALTVNRALVERLVCDPSGEPIVIAARALGMKAAVLQRILLFLNPAIGQSVQRVYDLARLFDEITPAAAVQMVEIWRMAGGKRRQAHQTVHSDDERRSARSYASHARHRAGQERAPHPAAPRKTGS